MAWTGRVPGGARKGWYAKVAETTPMTDGSLHDLITTVGIDLGKNVFHLIGHGQVRQDPPAPEAGARPA